MLRFFSFACFMGIVSVLFGCTVTPAKNSPSPGNARFSFSVDCLENRKQAIVSSPELQQSISAYADAIAKKTGMIGYEISLEHEDARSYQLVLTEKYTNHTVRARWFIAEKQNNTIVEDTLNGFSRALHVDDALQKKYQRSCIQTPEIPPTTKHILQKIARQIHVPESDMVSDSFVWSDSEGSYNIQGFTVENNNTQADVLRIYSLLQSNNWTIEPINTVDGAASVLGFFSGTTVCLVRDSIHGTTGDVYTVENMAHLDTAMHHISVSCGPKPGTFSIDASKISSEYIFAAIGENPPWKYTLDGNILGFGYTEGETTIYDHVAVQQYGTDFSFSTKDISGTIQKQPCIDTATNREYPFSTNIRVRGVGLFGCADKKTAYVQGDATFRLGQTGPIKDFMENIGSVDVVWTERKNYTIADIRGSYMVVTIDDATIVLFQKTQTGWRKLWEGDTNIHPSACRTLKQYHPKIWQWDIFQQCTKK